MPARSGAPCLIGARRACLPPCAPHAAHATRDAAPHHAGRPRQSDADVSR
ncbi:hypothetical protein BURPS406E_O0181 [Burkholderia pseudomallei 406e]|nr:conserved hypothetical protein [Burkholderia pseudomallei 305]EDO83784.1 hypothetical protein BURPS406E_O0181 [Burkholderia pseudomallei 406e]EDS88520.1 hypothetical protein BURPSS13_L0029 [Burkholderia pseudomallei S13]EDU06587.1 hypothetical protein BURPS1655_0395 [Burkholderia pseudomallei 1655]